MMRTPMLCLFAIVTATSLAACGDNQAELGPNGGMNSLIVERDGVLEDLSAIRISLAASSTDTMRLELLGSVDPIENAADDEYSIVLELFLSRAELSALTLPESIVVDGTSRFIPPPKSSFEFTRSASASPVVDAAGAKIACFCSLDRAGTQKITGEVFLQKASDTQLYGSLLVTVDGFLPGQGTDSLVDIQSDFDVEINKAVTSDR